MAAGEIVEQFGEMCGRLGATRNQLTLALAVTWLLTVRHAFSICEILFPSDLERAMLMFVFAAAFVNAGTAAVVRAIEGVGDDGSDGFEAVRGCFQYSLQSRGGRD